MDADPTGSGAASLRPPSLIPPSDSMAVSARNRTVPESGGLNNDPDTCRICRGEATPEEPLFHPCKCSGSIKYVHQDCLMEWLSHSQKKHCELCKTSFRFTKLYAPTMPKKLPFLVFISHLARYFVRTILFWCRVALVTGVWLGCLPYLTRWEWSFFFWISEEGLISPQELLDSLMANGTVALANSSTTGTSRLTTAAAATANASISFPGLDAVSRPFYDSGNSSGGVSIFSSMVRLISDVSSAGAPAKSTPADSVADKLESITQNLSAAALPILPTRPTLLSDVAFLQNLTRYPSLNKTIVYALEGQIITILVIVCFILVILVRDYVVQQQPEINMRAAFAAAAADGGLPLLDELDDNDDAGRLPEDRQPGHEDDWETDSGSEADQADLLQPFPLPIEAEEEGQDGGDGRDGIIAELASDAAETGPQRPLHRRMPDNFFPPGSTSDGASRPPSPALLEADRTYRRRPSSPTLASSSPAQPQQGHSEAYDTDPGADLAGNPSVVREYIRVYREAGGDPDKILQIAREKKLEERLQYWLRPALAGEDDRSEKETGEDGPEEGQLQQQLQAGDNGKGKERALYVDAEDDELAEAGASLRPRANTDGPKRPEGIHPLASNSWAFPPPLSRTSPTLAEAEARSGSETFSGSEWRAGAAAALAEAAGTGSSELSDTGATAGSDTAGTAGSDTGATTGSDTGATAGSSPAASDGTLADNTNAADLSSSIWTRVTTPSGSSAQRTPPSSRNSMADHPDLDMREPLASSEGATEPTEGRAGGGVENRDESVAVAATAGPAEATAAAAPPAAAPEHVVDIHRVPERHGGILGSLADFMWRDLDGIDLAELPRALPELFDNDENQMGGGDGGGGGDGDRDARGGAEGNQGGGAADAGDGGQAAAAAAMEAEAIDEAEDLEGVMELLGMRGPIVALFQNAMFCAFLVTVSLLMGIFLPYNIGRLSIWLVAHPMRPVMMLFSLSRLLQDMAAVAMGAVTFALFYALHLAASAATFVLGGGGGGTEGSRQVLTLAPAVEYIDSTLVAVQKMFTSSGLRIMRSVSLDMPMISPGEMRNFSAISHEALVSLKHHVASAFVLLGDTVLLLARGDFAAKGTAAWAAAGEAAAAVWALVQTLPTVLRDPSSWVIRLDGAPMVVAVSAELAFWDGTDRSLAILMGYASLCLAAGLYLHRGAPFSSNTTGQEWEASLIDGLHQASGVLKVILIIGIEMLVFPLYCGLLLDVALLPLFDHTTVRSRLAFTWSNPLTSIFVHWFVGTGYMFHFALFVSMCRKIMRKGVLYFIRDPDDPEFHPVRDVLERNVTTQLRKILFSAFVYGALVIVCLGGVVWGLALAAPDVLPIHYSSNQPVLEFPIDLLFYNFLMPLAIRFFKPSDGLHSMYTWWFRKSARLLRLTWFLFGERRIDEEGTLVLAADSPYRQQLPWWRTLLLEYHEEDEKGQVVPKQWEFLARGGGAAFSDGAPASAPTPAPAGAAPAAVAAAATTAPKALSDADMARMTQQKRALQRSGQLIPDGRFVRAPASDQVKIPKGRAVFLDVTEDNEVLPTSASASEATGPLERDLYASADHYQLVYVPPHFRTRIFLFILFIWLFAAVTGVSFTIIPLLFGRRLFKVLIPSHIRTNDVYAFSIGIYVLGSALYLLFHARSLCVRAAGSLRRAATVLSASAATAARQVVHFVWRVAKLVYAYAFILLVFPLLATALVELYLLIPLHTYMYPGGDDGPASAVPPPMSAAAPAAPAVHTVRIIQSWTLGLLYMNLGARTMTSWYADTRLAAALRAVLRRGRLDPDVRLLTRAFVVPGLVLGAALLALPPLLARAFLASEQLATTQAAVLTAAEVHLVYRLSYPLVALVGMLAWSLLGMVDVMGTWKVRIRDEAYLIGERLHNFGATAAGGGSGGSGGSGGLPAARRGHRAGGGGAAERM